MKSANKIKKGRPSGGAASTGDTSAAKFEYGTTPEDNGAAGRSMGFNAKKSKAKANMAMYKNPLS